MPDAEDLVQATLTEVFRSWRSVQQADDVDGDVYRILVNTAYDPRRRRVDSTPAPLDSGDMTAGMAARRTVADMSREERQILVLRYFLDLSAPTTAELLGLPVSEVSVNDEGWARNLVHEASETIDVAPSAFVPTPQSRRVSWPWLVAAGIALVIGVGIGLGWWSADDKPDDVVPNGQRQIPSVFGYDASSARQLLEAKGWDVTEVDSFSCEPEGRALATVPQAGARPDSSRIKLLVSVPADNLGCGLGQGMGTGERALAWRVLDFARNGSPLEFSDEVAVFVNGQHEIRPGSEADLRSLPLTQDLVRVLTDDANAVRVEGGAWTTPRLATKMDRGGSLCGGLDLPKGFGNRESLLMDIALPTVDGSPGVECHFLNVFSTAGVIDGLVLRTGLTTTPQGPTAVVPDVVGLEKSDARAALRTDGFAVETRASDGCPGTKVVEQNPEAGVIAKYGSKVRLEIGREAANTCL